MDKQTEPELSDLTLASEAYEAKFNLPLGYTMWVDEDEQARIIWRAVATGVPIPEDFDWYGGQPEDSLA